MKMRKMLPGALGLFGALFWVSGDGALYAADAALTIGDPVNVGNPTTFSGVGGTNTAGGALTALATFEAAIGGANNGANPTPAAGGFRVINSDAAALARADFVGSS